MLQEHLQERCGRLRSGPGREFRGGKFAGPRNSSVKIGLDPVWTERRTGAPRQWFTEGSYLDPACGGLRVSGGGFVRTVAQGG